MTTWAPDMLAKRRRMNQSCFPPIWKSEGPEGERRIQERTRVRIW